MVDKVSTVKKYCRIWNSQNANGTGVKKIEADQPDKIFTIDGGCDTDFPAISCISEKYKDKLKILYFDAHGDINSLEESQSKLFYGMLLRCLLKGSESSAFPIVKYGITSEQMNCWNIWFNMEWIYRKTKFRIGGGMRSNAVG